MKGGIYCGRCGRKIEDHEKACREHPTARFRTRIGGVPKRFRTKEEAERFLTYGRYMIDEERWDPQDYRVDNPLQLRELVKEWNSIKAEEVTAHTLRTYDRWLTLAMEAWGPKTNIKAIGYREIQKFLLDYPGSDKTRANIRAGLHSFFAWIWKAYGRTRLKDASMPEFPAIDFSLEFRDTLSKENQQAVLDELYRQTWHVNKKIWLAVFLLATYPVIRPKELLGITEEDLLLDQGFLRIRNAKEGRPKLVPILEEDSELIGQIRDEVPRGLPGLPFFRDSAGRMGIPAGKPFGRDYLYRWWKRAAAALGIDGVGLYAGTKHSTVQALDSWFGKEEIKDATGHRTNAAFERYYGRKPDRQRKVYRKARPQTGPGTKVEQISNARKRAKTE